ncbi:MAG TPA: T9SS type A sorting domain-containing protein, partial [Ignavibacteria bacterium]|nr:T9SS type A sorting domain-containing protein [Ignavibacteria bacterium]
FPETFELKQNYPNPFNPETVIVFSVVQASNVKLNVYDAAGSLVKQLVNDEMNAGTYKVSFNAAGLSSGVYFYRLESNGLSSVKKMLL